MEKIGKYEILDKIGSGGFAVVYKGRDPFIKRLVAIKVCYSRDENTRERFYREAEIAGQLVHRNITTVYDFGLHGEMPFLVEEYLSGEDLAHALRRREPESLEEKLDCLLQIASGLGHAHSRGVIHRDVKPGNVRLLDSGRVKIMDFGTAKLTDVESHLTQAGITLGTVAYLSPERLQGHPGDLASDLFSYGALAYELLSFHRPFPGRNIPSLIDQVLNSAPVPLVEVWPDCPPRLAEIVHKCLEKDPRARYPSCQPVIADLEAFLTEHTAATRGPEAQPAADEPALQVTGFLKRAQLLLDQGKRQRAEMLLREVLEIEPANARARRLLALATEAAEVRPAATPAVPTESPEAKRARKIAEASRSIESYLESGELARAGAALRFAHQLLGSFDGLSALHRRLIDLFQRQLTDLRGRSQQVAEQAAEALTAAVAGGGLTERDVERWRVSLAELDPEGKAVERLDRALELERERRREATQVSRRDDKQREAVASIERYLAEDDPRMAARALDFALEMLGELEGADDLRARIEQARSGSGS